jgi:hypothetical protein
MKIAAFAAVGAIALSASLGSTGSRANGFDFNSQCRSGFAGDRRACEDFTRGVVAGILVSPHPSICVPQGYDPRLSVPIVEQFMQAHPKALNQRPAYVVQAALETAYPCDDRDVRSVLGVVVQNLSPVQAQNLRVNATSGVVIVRLEPNAAAAKAGLEEGDVVTAVNDRPLLNVTQLQDAIGEKQPGTTVKVTFWRHGREHTTTATLSPA